MGVHNHLLEPPRISLARDSDLPRRSRQTSELGALLDLSETANNTMASSDGEPACLSNVPFPLPIFPYIVLAMERAGRRADAVPSLHVLCRSQCLLSCL